MPSWLRSVLDRWHLRRRIARVGRLCGCVCFCPLNDQQCEDVGEAVYRYTCSCGTVRLFDFSWPAPVMIEEVVRGG